MPTQPIYLSLRVVVNHIVRKPGIVIEEDELYGLLRACQKGDARSQEKLYRHYYGYSMSVCLRYSRDKEEAVEIVNDGFMKVFSKLGLYTQGRPFRGWLRRIMINSAIDYYRRNEKHYHNLDISHAGSAQTDESALDALSAEEIMAAVQQLPPSYRMVFNLHAIEGFKHEEISDMLNISVGTSKSNLSVARSKLKKYLLDNRGDQLISFENG